MQADAHATETSADPDERERMADNALVVGGDARREEGLRQAGVDRADEFEDLLSEGGLTVEELVGLEGLASVLSAGPSASGLKTSQTTSAPAFARSSTNSAGTAPWSTCQPTCSPSVERDEKRDAVETTACPRPRTA